jgi:hypothetical protein
LGKNEIHDEALIDLWGVVRVSEVTIQGISILNFDGFAPAAHWEEPSVFTTGGVLVAIPILVSLLILTVTL